MSTVESDVNVVRVAAAIRGMFIRQPQVLEILGALDGLRHAGANGGEVACLMITGLPGVGKSTLLTRFEATHPRRDVEDRTVVPVLYVRVPPRATVKGLAKAMLLRLGSEFAHRGDEIDLTHQVLTLLHECRVELLVLDEANHLVDRGAAKTHYQVADWLKTLAKIGVELLFWLAYHKLDSCCRPTSSCCPGSDTKSSSSGSLSSTTTSRRCVAL